MSFSLYLEFNTTTKYKGLNITEQSIYNKITTTTLLIKTSEVYEVASLYKPEVIILSENKLLNPSFETAVKINEESIYYKFVDSYGLMAFPWGFEIQGGSPICVSNSTIAYTGKFSIQITGLNANDSVLFALPGFKDKPKIKPFIWYRFEAWVKLSNVNGPGLRLIQQFFNGSYIWYPEYSFYGKWYIGDSDWMKIYLDARTLDEDNYVGDPVIQFIGVGIVWIDDVAFYEIRFEFPFEHIQFFIIKNELFMVKLQNLKKELLILIN